MNKKIIIGIVITLFLAIGLTYAWWTWNSTTNTDVSLTIDGININYEAGSDITNIKLLPVTSKEKGVEDNIAIKKDITVSSNTNVYMDLNMSLELFPDGLKHESLKWEIYKDNTLVNSGNLGSSNQGDVVKLLSSEKVTTVESIYTLYIWIDGNVDNPDTMQNQNFKFVLNANATDAMPLDTSGANAPKLVENMIPVMYNGEAWVKADSTNTNSTYKWYAYQEKQWGNAVLVSSTNRSTYLNAAAGTVISESDVLAYYVWIPRYKYKVFNVAKTMGTDSYNAKTTGIDIVFEEGTSSTGEINCNNYSFAEATSSVTNETCSGTNGQYYTHPAFTFGDKELEGIWVGKFEVSGSTTQIKTVPNVSSLRSQTVSDFYSAIKSMQNSGNVYGLSSDTNRVDSHMLKNLEWGAVAYLTHSNYGRCSNGTCEEVTINNSSSYITGNAGNTVSDGYASGITLAYNQNKKQTSVSGGSEITPSITNDATYPWVLNDGVYSSGNSKVKSSTSTLTYSFNLSNKGAIVLDYSVSSENNYDKLIIKVDNTTVVSGISGTSRGTSESSLKYDNLVYSLEAGSHTVTISYSKDSSGDTGLDKAYIKNVKVLNNPNITEIEVPGGQLASSTGNIYGIYDLSGGAFEYVMGNMSSGSGSYTYNPKNAGSNFSYSAETAKYIDTYAYGTTYNDQTAYNRARLGDATGEVVARSNYAWNNDRAYFVYSSYPWFQRGGSYDDGSNAGVFYFYNTYGDSNYIYSARAALIAY